MGRNESFDIITYYVAVETDSEELFLSALLLRNFIAESQSLNKVGLVGGHAKSTDSVEIRRRAKPNRPMIKFTNISNLKIIHIPGQRFASALLLTMRQS